MMRIERISSARNSKIKALLALLEKSSRRREEGLFVVEGKRETERCLNAGFKPKTLFLCEKILTEEEMRLLAGQAEAANPECSLILLDKYVYEKVAYREGTEGVLAEIIYKERRLEDIILGENPLIIVLEAVEKPGNLGAVLRSADAAGADAVVICDPCTDLYNPNLIRAGVGAVFSRQIAAATSESTISWLKAHNILIYTAQLQDSSLYYDTDMTGGTALVMGSESSGLSEIWRKAADKHIRIPMLGAQDSLNVSVSAAILMFEAVRQRNSQKTLK